VAHKQEREAARREVTEVAPGVLRMQLPIHMPGLGHVNCYALLDARGAALVDPGLPGPSSARALEDRLRQAGLRVRDVHTVIVTHSHPDHFGGASRLSKAAGADVVGQEGFMFGWRSAPPDQSEVSVEDLEPSPRAHPGEPARRRPPGRPSAPWGGSFGGPTPWGGKAPGPPLRSRARYAFFRMVGSRFPFVPEITRPVKDGDVLRLARREFFVMHTPGHTADHICLHDPAEGVFLAGDHVLPSITPHISGLGQAVDPLRAFFESLERVAEIPHVRTVLPAHGHPFPDLAARAHAIQRHHDERLLRVKEIGRELGVASVQAYSRRLFPARSWGGMAESETFAHLAHLRLSGEAERREEPDGKLVYQTG
jgi:glyoxylase-like metal-dependent hydrolase (beta-lactamase superfamily II)